MSPSLWRLFEGGEGRFAAYGRGINVPAGRVIARLALVVTPLYWLSDFLVFGGGEVVRRSAMWRLAICLLAAASLPLLRWMERDARLPLNFTLGALGCAAAAILGAGVGSMAGVEGPLFAGFYLLPCLVVPFVLPLRLRILATVLMSSTALTCFFGVDPAHLHERFAPMAIGLVVFACFMFVLIGHGLYRVVERNFTQAEELARAGVEMQHLNQDLESIVRSRTEELRDLLAHAASMQEADRQRIAREIHDDLGQQLSAMGHALERLGSGDPVASAAMRAQLDRSVAAVRRAISDLRPPMLDELGLAAAVEALLRAHEERFGCACVWIDDVGDQTLPEQVSTAAFRILQEALTNTGRHARARNVEVRLELHDSRLRVIVSDDGVGFDLTGERPARRFGLIGMRERARACGGELAVESAPGTGTVLRVELPLPSLPEAARPSTNGAIADDADVRDDARPDVRAARLA